MLLTHFHADHTLGLPGMLKTFALRGRDAPLTVVGPPGLYGFMEYLKRLFGRLTFPVDWVELQPGEPIVRDHYRIEPVTTDHGVSSVGLRAVRAGAPGSVRRRGGGRRWASRPARCSVSSSTGSR